MGLMLPRIRAISDCEDFGQTTHKFRSNHPMFSVKPPLVYKNILNSRQKDRMKPLAKARLGLRSASHRTS
jgi:hypothetical protein